MSENIRGPIGETSRHLSTHLREHLVSTWSVIGPLTFSDIWHTRAIV